jgi:hypothetical protein
MILLYNGDFFEVEIVPGAMKREKIPLDLNAGRFCWKIEGLRLFGD